VTSEDLNLDDVRAHAQRIVDQAKADSEFANRLKADPEGTLRDAGLDEQAIPDFARELSDVEGHAITICTILSCLLTKCGYLTY
jgi:hypothetical protein